MNEKKRTLMFAGVAAAMALIAFIAAPRSATPDAFLDQGEPFFPTFDDPNTARTLEVVEFNEETAEASPFKVAFTDGRWTIPSHHDYPADGRDRLARTAAGVIGIRKDDFRSNSVADHEACGVVDPLDEGATTLKGRGKRVTLRGENDQVLADFIVGNPLPDRKGLRFVRIPDQKRVYAARMDIDLSTAFQDWIEKDLTQVDREAIDRVVLRDYSVNERTRRVARRDVVSLSKKDDLWSIDRIPAGREVDQGRVDYLLQAIDDLTIVGIRPKPPGLSQSLRRVEGGMQISQTDLRSLQNKGYYFSHDGRLLSNEGELQAHTTDGITYTLRFGEIVYGRGQAITAGTQSSDDTSSGQGENRYLFITVEFDPARFPEPPSPTSLDFQNKAESEWSDADRRNREAHDRHEEWRQQVAKGRTLAEGLNERFARWYYVISAASFDALQVKRADLITSPAA